MKYYETHYDEYLRSAKQLDLHSELDPVREKMPSDLNQLGNLILYGPMGSGKYTQMLRLIEAYSPSRLKYDKKITAQTDKLSYIYRISDIHYEVDLSLLGCESKRLWNECFFQIVDIVSMKPDKAGIIVCKNFHAIHSELLDVFYSYMQHCNTLTIHLVFCILTEHVSFIPNNITQCCKMISIRRPSKSDYLQLCKITENPNKMVNSATFVSKISTPTIRVRTNATPIMDEIAPESILNLKEIHEFSMVGKAEDLPRDTFNIVCDGIIHQLLNHRSLKFAEFRDHLYDILLYGLDITDCLWYILYHFIKTGKFKDPKSISNIMSKTYTFLKYYNNNYRPIYHLESIFFYIIIHL